METAETKNNRLLDELTELRLRVKELKSVQTKNEQTRKELRESEEKFRKITSSARDGIIMMDHKGSVSYWNPAAEKIFGYTAEEVLGKQVHLILAPRRNHSTFKKSLLDFTKTGEGVQTGNTLEFISIKKDGTEFPMELSVSSTKLKDRWNAIGVIRDITERKNFEEKLRLSEEKYSTLFQNSNDAIFIHTLDGRIIDLNQRVLDLFGYTKTEILGLNIKALHPPQAQWASKIAFDEITREEFVQFEIDFKKKNSEIFPAEVSSSILEIRGEKVVQGIVRDITERRRAEDILKESEERFRSVVENANNGILIIDSSFRIIYANAEFSRIMGFAQKEIINADFRKFLDEETSVFLQDRFMRKQAEEDLPQRYELNICRKDGEERRIEFSALLIKDSSGNIRTVVHLVDVTDRKRVEEKEKQYIQDLTFLSRTATGFVELQPEADIYKTIGENLKSLKKDAIVAVVSYNKDTDLFKVRALFRVSKRKSVIQKLLGETPLGMTVKVKKKVKDILTTAKLTKLPGDLQSMISGKIKNEVWQRIHKTIGGGDIYAIGLCRKGELYGAAVLMPPKGSKIENLNIIDAFINQASMALQRTRTEDELMKSYERLRETLEMTVEALASAVEMKDPYTAGHQQRVARLACAIGEEMKLAEEQISGIRVAAAIHDIGKIYIPSEILSKPGLLSELETDLIKTHPQVSYDILKTINFPWPVAQIILQHHEKMDGTGYPRKLIGKEILLEARILAVADVVEAISSHRPYRPSLGLKSAVKEISQYKGTSFDTEVVDACLTVLVEKKFTF